MFLYDVRKLLTAVLCVVPTSAAAKGAALLCLLVALLCVPPEGRAQEIEAEPIVLAEATSDMGDSPGFELEREDGDAPDWSFALGAVAGIVPDYEGSDDYDFEFGPQYKIDWRRIVVLSGKTLRVYALRGDTRLGAVLGLEGGRDDDDDLEGLGDVDSGAEAGIFISHKIGKVTLRSEVRREFAGGHGGTLVDLGARMRVPLGEKPWLKAELETTWADGDYMDSFFGINARQSFNSGLRQFDADSGFKNVSLALTTGYDITDSWKIGVMVGYRRMLGDAADSPVVEDVGSRNQFTTGLGLSYNF